MAVDDCFSSYFLIAVLIVFFMLLYVYVTPSNTPPIIDKYRQLFTQRMLDQRRIESFQSNNQLIPMEQIRFVQGNGVPDKDPGVILFDQDDPAAQSVDGTQTAPRALFPFAFNKCDVNCCGDSAGLSCNGGCVCLTDEQKRFFSNRGFNNKNDPCVKNEF